MKAAEQHFVPVPPPKVFPLSPASFADTWKNRPTTVTYVGLRRVPAEDRVRCDAEAIKHADRLMPVDRRHRDDPMWQRCYEITFIHYLIGFALAHPQDGALPLWPAQDGLTMLVFDPDALPEQCPVASMRFSEAGIARIFDEMDLLAREDAVTRRMASAEELIAVGEVLADGSFFARLKQAGTPEALAVGEHIRMLAGGILDVMERGRESPLPIGK